MTAALLFCTLAFAQEPKPADDPPREASIFGRRYDAFRGMFASRNVPLGSVDAWRKVDFGSAKDWVVVVLGSSEHVPQALHNWREFVNFGGRLLIACDLDEAVPLDSSARFRAGPVSVTNRALAVEGQLDCPMVFDLPENHPLFRGVGAVGLNRAGWLDGNVPFNARNVTRATLPADARGPDGEDVGGRTAVAAFELGTGRVLLASDPSIFINEMMLDPTGEPLNAAFARNTVDWLLEGRDPESLNVLFVEDGVSIGQWIDPRYLTGEWPTNEFQAKLQAADKLLRTLNAFMLEQQARRDPNTGRTLYNQAIRNFEVRFPEGFFWRWALMLVAALAALWLTIRLFRRSVGPAKPLPEPTPERTDGLLDRKRREVLEEGHYVDVARRLARLWLEKQLGGPPTDGPPRTIVVDGGGRTQRHWQRRWNHAWTLATGGPHPPMSLADLNRFRHDLSKLESAVTNILP